MTEEEFERTVSLLYNQGKLDEIIILGKSEYNCKKKQRILWAWPTFDDLKWIKQVIIDYKIEGIVSVGCGTGLLEWIIKTYSDCDVIGIEADKRWWTCKHSPPLYLDKVIFVDKENKLINFPANYAILFCYFNNAQAFCNYVNNYKGEVLLIIGPDEGTFKYTDPLPFDGKINKLGWKLARSRKMDDDSNYVTVYTRAKDL